MRFMDIIRQNRLMIRKCLNQTIRSKGNKIYGKLEIEINETIESLNPILN